MLLRKLRKVFVDLADSLIVAFLSQRIGQDLLKRFFLGFKGDRCRRTEAGVNELGVEFFRIFGEIWRYYLMGCMMVEMKKYLNNYR